MSAVLALDVGGTKLAAARVSREGRVVRRAQVPTPVSADPEVLWDAVVALLDPLAAESPVDGVGIGCGGPMRWPQGEVSPVNIPAWRGFPLLDRVRDRYAGPVPAVIHNDAIAMALAEARWGAGAGSRHMLGMVVSTGVGGGIVIDGRVVDGASGNAGHIGHVVVDPQGPPCACGGRGCLEAMARGPAIAADAVARGWSGEPTAVGVAAGAAAGDPAARAAFERAGEALGVAVASVAALLDLDVVVVGGGVALSGDLLFGPARRAFGEHAGLDFARRARLEPAALGADAGVIGAAALVLDVLTAT
jgi:glucokinase